MPSITRGTPILQLVEDYPIREDARLLGQEMRLQNGPEGI